MKRNNTCFTSIDKILTSKIDKRFLINKHLHHGNGYLLQIRSERCGTHWSSWAISTSSKPDNCNAILRLLSWQHTATVAMGEKNYVRSIIESYSIGSICKCLSSWQKNYQQLIAVFTNIKKLTIPNSTSCEHQYNVITHTSHEYKISAYGNWVPSTNFISKIFIYIWTRESVLQWWFLVTKEEIYQFSVHTNTSLFLEHRS